jgi:FMN phosphatase YigB (HAD superfamily)
LSLERKAIHWGGIGTSSTELQQRLGQTVMVNIEAVLFDFSDTLFWRDGVQRMIMIASQHGVTVPTGVAAQLWSSIRERSVSPEEIAKHRDTSMEAHRRCWTALYQPLEHLMDGFAQLMYDDQPNPNGFVAFPETVQVLTQLHQAGMPIAVVSDIGWDLRPIFAHHGVAECINAWVLSFAHGIEKPDPRMLTMACDVLGVSPHNSLMVGDNLKKDGGAVHAGVRALVLPAWRGVGERGLRAVVDAAIGSRRDA